MNGTIRSDHSTIERSDTLRYMEKGRRGRQVEAERNDAALLDAARVVFAVYGADASVARIAARAGVGVGSLYRRFPTKEALLQHLCLTAMEQTIVAADVALADDDAWRGLCTLLETCAHARTGAFVGLGRVIPTTAPMNRTFTKSQERLEAFVQRAHEAGCLRRDINAVDLRLLIEAFSRRPPDDGMYRRVLAIAIDGLRVPRSRTALEGPAPTVDAYYARWKAPPPPGDSRTSTRPVGLGSSPGRTAS